MSNARFQLAFASENLTETMFPPDAPFFSKAWETSRFPAPLPAHERGARS
jgi:hypothetical protein